jgi:predicted RecA/RadA family phage recombinase
MDDIKTGEGDGSGTETCLILADTRQGDRNDELKSGIVLPSI